MGRRRIFLFLYTASGAAALVYEVAWTRMLTLQFGHTVAAASIVLAAFMGGLAAGASLASGATRAAKGVNLLRLYALLEIGVAVCALLLPPALAATTPALAWAYADGAAPAQFAIVRVVVALVLLGIPAAAMGATFPVAAAWFARRAADSGLVYAVNTAGAAAGAIAAGFFLVPALGLRATTWVGVALNVAAAAGAFWIAREGDAAAITVRTVTDRDAQSRRRQRSARTDHASVVVASAAPLLAYAAAAVSGFTALIYEVAWTRLLALVLGPTTYAFATMAAAFITGLAIGSAAAVGIARATKRPAVWLAATLIVAAVAASGAAYATATRMPLFVAAQVSSPDVSFTRVVWVQALAAGVLLLPMTLALGAAFPLAIAVAAPRSVAGAPTGPEAARVYTANTVGAIAGALLAGFFLVPQLGLQETFRWTGVLGLAAGGGCAAAAMQMDRAAPRPRRLVLAAAAMIGALALLIALPPWDRELLASGAYKYAPYLAADDLDAVLRAGRLEYYKEGAASTVSVRRLTGTTSLAIDGKIDASNAGDMLTQRLLGLLPMLLHGNAHDVCVIGLGSGVTVGAALAPGGVRRLDVVEISPEVVEASRFFDGDSGAPLAKPGVRLIVGDGRSHLLLTSSRYDVIISEPSNPWMAGVAALFTREFFEAARARLNPDGLLCQWAHTYDISAEDLKSIVRTFASVFPEGSMWLVGESDLLLVGPNGGSIAERLSGIGERSRKGSVATALDGVGIAAESAAFDLLSLYAGGPEALAAYAADGPLQTDDRMALEYSAPRGIYGRSTSDNADGIRRLAINRPAALKAVFDGATAGDWTSRGRMLLKAEAYALAFDAFRRAVALDSRSAPALAGLSDAAGAARRQNEAMTLLRDVAAKDPSNGPARVELSRLQAATGDLSSAAETAADALRLDGNDPRAGEQLASVVADAGDASRLGSLAKSLAARFPGRPDPQYYRASALFLSGRTEDAITAVRQVTDTHPDHARAQNLLGAACATLGRADCARAAFAASLRANPRDAGTYANLGQFLIQTGDPAAAAGYFAEALTIDPSSPAARNGLVQARALAAANPR